MRRILLASFAGFLLLSIASAAPSSPSQYASLRAAAEREYSEKSFARAHELYQQAAALDLAPDDRQWVAFRLADTTIRAGLSDRDPRKRQSARDTILDLIEAREDAAAEAAGDDWVEEEAAVDELSAEMHEALGDSYLLHPYEQRTGEALAHYLAALEWWARSTDLERARARYLAIAWRIADNQYGIELPREILVDAVAIATTDEDRARARFLLAERSVREGGNPQSIDRGLELLEEVIAIGRATPVYDDALSLLASQLTQRGVHRVVGPAGETLHDHPRALALYRRLVAEFQRGETPFYDSAQQAIREITTPALDVQVAGTFLPDSEQELILSWRNVKRVDLALVAVDLSRDVAWDGRGEWTKQIAIDGRDVVRRWTFDTKDAGDHQPGREAMLLTPRLAPGAYVITAAGDGGVSDRNLLLVTDAHILTHAGRERVDAHVSNVETGKPLPNARVRFWQGGTPAMGTGETRADDQGLSRLTPGERNGMLLVTAAAGDRQAFHHTYGYWHRARNADAPWRIYAFTDRPAYRPGETVKWKILARVREGEQWITPDGESLAYEITGPRGKVAEGTATLTSFGSFWAELPLTAEMPLGVYDVSFRRSGAREHKGSAMLFRLEEYKLPEFRVRVSTAEGITPRLGDTLEVTIDAQYYFGGPVANAEVEAVVYEEPLYHHWHPSREYGWLYPPTPRPSYQPGRVRETQRLRTAANGEATLRVYTPRDGSDTSYRIEARVVDASRREVSGSATVRVMRHRYSVFARPEHFVHRVNASVSIDFKAVDANDNPVKTRGTVTVVRRTMIAPPEPVPRPRGRRTIPPSVTKDEEILQTQLETDAKGEATLSFTPRAAGHYVVRWTSDEESRPADKVTAETAVFVSDRATTDVGYRSGGGLDVILDRDTVAPGSTATVMLVTPAPGRWAVVSFAGSDLFETQVVRMDGTVRLLELPVEAAHAPALFVTASSIFDREAAQDSERIVVPPLPQLLDVEVTTDRGEYQPRDAGRVTVTTRDANGRPVAAEVALSVSDEAVTAIQEDPAGDPRAFFYGDARANPLQPSYGLHAQRYVLIRKPSDDTREAGGDERLEREEADPQRDMGRVTGNVGAAPPPPPAPVAQSVSESITVTAASPAMLDTGGSPEVIVRSDFRSTAFWQPDIVTGADGTATVELTWPDALTTWRATARAATTGAQFGMATATARTSMPLLVRLQAPRFFVAGDRATVSAVMNNNTDQSLTVTPSIESAGLRLESPSLASAVTIAPHGEARADWTVLAEAPPAPVAGDQPGTPRDPVMAKLTVTARSDRFNDAMERELPVYEHGIDKLVARSGKLRGSDALVRLELPAERRATALTVSVTPSIAVMMLDALPYLVEFPYGCTEQTMSRFLPAAVVARTIERLGLGRARLAGKPLDAVTAAGIARLYDMQNADGGWGWWTESGSDPFMTAYVVWGFAIARGAGLSIDTDRIDRAAAWLDASLVKHEKAVNDQAWMLHALSAWRKSGSPTATRAFDNAWQKREALTPYGRALLALTGHRWGSVERAQILVKNLEDGVRLDRTPDQSVLLQGATAEETMATAYWGAPGFWWRWYEGPVETTSFVLQALVSIDPKHRLVEPAMNWLVKNRRGSRWNNTRDTAIALLAMNDYLEASGEIGDDVSYEVAVNGRVIATKTVAARAALDGPGQILVPADAITSATQEIRIRRTAGTAPLYFAAEARFVSLEEPVKAAGNELFVRRQYFRLAPRPTLLRGVEYERVALRDGEPVASGDRIEVAVTVEAKNDYEYLLFEDLKPAGLEATVLQSGGRVRARNLKTNAQVFVYQELRDRTVASFIDRLDQGLWELRYELRAETPGTFHALPLLGQAMYVPEIRANGDEVRVVVRE